MSLTGTNPRVHPHRSLRVNIFANIVGQAFSVCIGMVMLPIYVRYMGAEAYGLVGFLAVLQAWFVVFDLGLTPTLSRELSRFRAEVVDELRTAAAVRTLEWLFVAVGVFFAGIMSFAAKSIAENWLKAETLQLDELRLSLIYMGLIIGARCWSGLYRSGLAGLERMIALNAATMAIAALRSIGALFVFEFWTTSPRGFFAFQFLVALLELGLMAGLFYRAFPMRCAKTWPSFQSLRELLSLSGSMVFLSVVWIVISQTDRLVLSWVLGLADYAFFMVTIALTGLVSIVVTPLTQALQPRFSMLAAQGRSKELQALYQLSTQLTAAIVFAVAAAMTCFGEELLFAWTQDPVIAREGARLVPLYAIGNALVAVLGVAFLIQFAYGKLRWHVVGNCLFGVLWIPGAYLAAAYNGAIGTGWVWLLGNAAFLACWLPFVHRKLVPELWWRWLVQDVGVIFIVIGLSAALISNIDLTFMGRYTVLGSIALAALILFSLGIFAGNQTRTTLLSYLRGASLFSMR